MANSTHTHSDFAGVEVIVLAPVRKGATERFAVLSLAEGLLPLQIAGADTNEAKDNAFAFYKEHILNSVLDLSSLSDPSEALKALLSGLAPKPDPVAVKVRKNAAQPKVKGPDKRHEFKGLLWYVSDAEKPVRIREEQVQEFLDKGFVKGKVWEKKISERTKRLNAPDYTNPIAGKVLMHRGSEYARVIPSEIEQHEAEGWKKGRKPAATVDLTPAPTAEVTAEAPQEAADAVSQA